MPRPIAILLATLSLLLALPAAWSATAPVRIIFDTDYETDCDDPGALAVLHALADRGEAEILATISSGRNTWSAAAIDVVNTWYRRPGIPIGATRRGVVKASRYTQGLAERFPHDTGTIDQVPEAAALYRQVLAAQPDASVVVVTVGYMTNLEDLLKSGPDAHSPLAGIDLVRRKVKQWVCMGGNFFHLSTDNTNFRTDPVATMHAITNWPTNITFVGREVGSVPSPIDAGAVLAGTPADNPVRVAYELYFGGVARDRHCADLTTVLYAVRGLRDYWDIETDGSMHFINTQSDFEWRASPDKDQDYLVPKGGWQVYSNQDYIEATLDALLIQPPGTAGGPGTGVPGHADLIDAGTYAARSAGWDGSGEWAYALAHDGNAGTEIHASSAAEQWLEYDLGAPFSLSRVRVFEDNAGSYSLGQWRFAYHDGAAWRDAFANRPASAAGWHEVALPGIVATRVRLHCQAPSGALLELFEFECYGTPEAPEATGAIAINFQPAGAPTVAGWLVDAGAAFADRGAGRSYGWDVAVHETRDRNSANAADQRYDTLNHLQKGAARTWEITLPNGVYEVRAVCGDPAHTDQINTLRIEGVTAADPDGQDRFDEHTVVVTVADGRLTVAPGPGAVNAKLCFIEIVAVPSGSG